jgi:hypothetical protein
MSDNNEINELEKRIELLRSELQKTNLIGNKNLPIIIKYLFVFVFFIVMLITKPDLVEKIFQIFAVKAVGIIE